MRISDGMITANMVYRLNRASERLFRVQEQAASGLRFTQPSQDPASAVRAASLRSSLSEIERYLQNADLASSALRLTEVAITSLSDALREARTLAVAGMNDGLDETARQAIAEQVAQIAQEIFRVGNYHDGSRYLLAGYKVRTPPLAYNATPPPPVSYQGDRGEIAIQLGRGVTIVTNLDAAVLLNLDGAADPALEDVFTTLENLETALRTSDHANIEAALGSLEVHSSRVLGLRGEIGARVQRVDFDRRRLEEARDAARILLGETEGADLAEVVVELQQNQVAYQAAAAACALLTRASLMDYLR